jgi:hypothetical protein
MCIARTVLDVSVDDAPQRVKVAMRIWAATPYGTKEPLDVSPSMRIEAVRRRIGQLPAIMEESGAWTINGWQARILKSTYCTCTGALTFENVCKAPKIMHGAKLLVDGRTLEECG